MPGAKIVIDWNKQSLVTIAATVSRYLDSKHLVPPSLSYAEGAQRTPNSSSAGSRPSEKLSTEKSS